jgi:hypothetical protein
MPIIVLFIIGLALYLALSSVRSHKTSGQRKSALLSLCQEFGGQVEDYADGGLLKLTLAGWPGQLRMYALPKEPLAVSTEILLEMGDRLPVACEILGDRLGPAFRRALGLSEKEMSFGQLFRDPMHSGLLEDSVVQENLLELWKMGPPKHTRLSCQAGTFMLSKDQDFCAPERLRHFVSLAEALARHLSEKGETP